MTLQPHPNPVRPELVEGPFFFSLLDLMAPPCPPKWRAGVALPRLPYTRPEQGDLQWMAHDYRDHRTGGRWFWFDGSEQIWRCIDPLDQCGINKDPDNPPAVNACGTLLR